MAQKTKLELTWIGKENRPRLEPRILLEDPEKSYHAAERFTENDSFENRLIQGDNLLALKSLEQEFTGKIKCIYIDPPFNTGQAMEHYDDGLEHSIWLSLIRERVEILRRLLSDDGTLFVHIDDNELGYLIVLLDEVFNRSNRLYTVTFRQGSATGHKSINPGCVSTTNFVLIYAKNKGEWKPNRVYTSRERDKRYTQVITNRESPFSEWSFTTLGKAFADHLGISQAESKKQLEDYETSLSEFVINNADRVIRLARPSYDDVSAAARAVIDESRKNPKKLYFLKRDGLSDMYFVGGERILFYSDKLKIVDGVAVAGEPLTTLWDDILSNNLHNEGDVEFPKGKKPEALLKRILELSTAKGDLVLDSFAGSGTTGAVAHKMQRRWIMIELRDHCDTHIAPRMRRVVDGMDSSGVTHATKWSGGGGFRYYRLAPSLLEKDKFGNLVISKQYNPTMLTEAMCKIMSYRYRPSDTVFWQHGQSTETDFIYVTTQTLSHEQLAQISEEVGDHRSLLICCAAFRAKPEAFPNLTLKKIPRMVLSRCEWGKDDYSLQIASLPPAPKPEPQHAKDIAPHGQPSSKEQRKARVQLALFGGVEE